MSSATHDGEAFTVVDQAGGVVFDGTLRDAGRPVPWAHAARADWSAVTAPGRYRVHAAGLVSRPWVVRDSAARPVIGRVLGFFEANRDGREPSPEHGPAHLHDATVRSGPLRGTRFDLTGGWMDAGDMIHFTATTSYAAMVLQTAADLDGRGARALRREAAVGVRWLVKAHPRRGLFVGQVGDGRDHEAGFRNPSRDDRSGLPGIAWRTAYPTRDAATAGKASAALALAALHRRGPARARLVVAAEQWYRMGAQSRRTHHTAFYNDPTWRDDLALAAVMLWRATGRAGYRRDAGRYLRKVQAGEIGLTDVGALAGADLCGALGRAKAPRGPARRRGCEVLRKTAEHASWLALTRNRPWATPGWIGWGQTGSQSVGGASAALAAQVGQLKTAEVAQRARDWLLGLNPWGCSFVVGFGPCSRRHPHHWASLRGPARPRGAVVGGAAPVRAIEREGFSVTGLFDAPRAAYEDRRAVYITAEPALDYAANAILLLAALSASS